MEKESHVSFYMTPDEEEKAYEMAAKANFYAKHRTYSKMPEAEANRGNPNNVEWFCGVMDHTGAIGLCCSCSLWFCLLFVPLIFLLLVTYEFKFQLADEDRLEIWQVLQEPKAYHGQSMLLDKWNLYDYLKRWAIGLGTIYVLYLGHACYFLNDGEFEKVMNEQELEEYLEEVRAAKCFIRFSIENYEWTSRTYGNTAEKSAKMRVKLEKAVTHSADMMYPIKGSVDFTWTLDQALKARTEALRQLTHGHTPAFDSKHTREWGPPGYLSRKSGLSRFLLDEAEEGAEGGWDESALDWLHDNWEDEEVGSRVCLGCLVKPACMEFSPCKHVAMCVDCAPVWFKEHKNCIFCGEPVFTIGNFS